MIPRSMDYAFWEFSIPRDALPRAVLVGERVELVGLPGLPADFKVEGTLADLPLTLEDGWTIRVKVSITVEAAEALRDLGLEDIREWKDDR